MKVVFVNLHGNGHLIKIMPSIITKKPMIAKHKFILDWLIDNNVEVVDYVTMDSSLLPSNALRGVTRCRLLRVLEANFVLRKSGYTRKQIRIITDPTKINKHDIVIIYGTVAQQVDSNCFSNGIKVVDFIHFFGDSQTAQKLKKWDYHYYMFEVNLAQYSKIYQRNYGWYDGEFIERPFAYQSRFCITTPFESRKNKAIAMGTVIQCFKPEFVETYENSWYQPHRKMIFDHAAEFPEQIDSLISPYEETTQNVIVESESMMKQLKKKWKNYFSTGQQKSYFSFNMVEKYNEYKMFVCPEDAQGSYGVGTIEGMACGCAMIGLNYGAFEDMGMRAGIHYIAYDGTMDDLVDKIKYYQMPEHQHELESIAANGSKYVRSEFSESAVAARYFENLKAVSNKVQAI